MSVIPKKKNVGSDRQTNLKMMKEKINAEKVTD